MRCAGLHRKVGTHVTKVKSLSMDSWTNEQVEVGVTKSKPSVHQTETLAGYEACGKPEIESDIQSWKHETLPSD